MGVPHMSYLKVGMFRNRGLLDLAHRIEQCQNCGAERSHGSDPAHSNYAVHGKGHKIKAHDCFFAALCSACHRWLDNQAGYGPDPSGRFPHTYEGKHDMFCRAMHKTWLTLWQLGFIKVA